MARCGRRLAAVVVAALCLGVTGCGGPAANEVDMGVAAFQQNAMTIRAGQAVHFVDSRTGGGVHALCIGTGLTCTPQAGAPDILNTTHPITFVQGDVRDIVFPQRGVYPVTCTIHPGMEVVITVQ
jgi:plastocyanin